jgi:hypothetical protein
VEGYRIFEVAETIESIGKQRKQKKISRLLAPAFFNRHAGLVPASTGGV